MAAQKPPRRALTLPQALLWVQGAYYVLTGVWPLVSIRSFVWVTGPKTDHLKSGLEIDHWLVMTAGVLITAIGLGIVVAAVRRTPSAEIITVAVGAAIGLTAIDVLYNWRGMIGPVYLIDAVIQILLIAAWSVALRFSRPRAAADN
jgi:hypothetical protein